MEGAAPTRDRLSRGVLSLLSLVAAAAAVWLSSGATGFAINLAQPEAMTVGLAVVVGAVGVGVALVTTGVYGVVLHHLGAVAAVGEPTVVGIVLLEVSAVLLLVSDVPYGGRLRTGAVLVPTVLLLGTGVVALVELSGLLVATAALFVVLGVGVYAFHRLTTVRLGLAATEMDGDR
jgi:hypothetical protein